MKPANSSTHFIDHATFIFLLDREGKYVAFILPGTSLERLAAMMRDLLPAEK